MHAIDGDLTSFNRDALVAEVKRLRNGIRAHRDSSGQGLCWHHPGLWGLLPDVTDPLPEVPAWPQFLRGCLKYRESLDEQLPDAPRTAEEYERRDSMPHTAPSQVDTHAFIKDVHGIRYQVKDVARSVGFYTRHLGFTLEHQ